MARQKTVIIVGGPTASGKTAVAIDLALHFGTEIISADSRQCYREMDIGVARPSPQELSRVKHHFIASHSIHDPVNAASFERYALCIADELFKIHDVVVMVGGTGLYIKAFCEGLDEIPEVSAQIRNGVISSYNQYGIDWLREQIELLDPAYIQVGEIYNPQRMMRALEVVKATGKSIRSFQMGEKALRNFSVKKFAIQVPREQLYERINQRVDHMIRQGLEHEVRSLIPFQHLNALQTVGYKELFDYFGGECTLEDAISRIKQHSRHYAKRQMTWFRKDASFKWVAPDQMGAMLTLPDN